MAGNFGGKIFWRIAENMSFGGIYFGNWASLSLLCLIWTVFVASDFTATMKTLFGSPFSHWQTSQLFSHFQCTKLFGEAMSYAAFNGELHADDYTGASSCRRLVHKLWFRNDGITLWILVDEILVDCSQNRQSAKISGHMVLQCWLCLVTPG